MVPGDALDEPQVVAIPQAHIQQDDARLQLLNLLEHVVAIGEGGDDLQVLLVVDHGGQAFAQEAVGLDENE